MSILRVVAAALTVVLISLGACTSIGDPNLLPVATGELALLYTAPAPNATAVPITADINLFFDAPLDARELTRRDVRLFSGLVEIRGRLRADLLADRLRFRPGDALLPELTYQVFVASGIRGLDSSALTRATSLSFTTDTANNAPPRPQLTPVSSERLQRIWDEHCTECHSGRSPPSGVDLSSPPATIRSLRGIPSAGSDLLRVQPDDHARSYLMLKLLGQFGFLGLAMPPKGAGLPPDDLRLVADWIDTGAQ